jgi:hypothetical protein
MILNIMIDTYERYRFARSVSRSKVKVICVLVAKLLKNHINNPFESLLMILNIIDTYERHRFVSVKVKGQGRSETLKIHKKRTGQSLLIIHNMIDTYERHRFARSLSRSRSKVKVICILVAKRKKNYIKSPVQSLLMELSTK